MLSTLGFCLYLAAQSFKNFCTLLGDKCVLFANVTTSVGSLYFLCSVGMRAGHQKGQGWIRAGGFQLRSPTSERWRRMRTELNRQWQGHVSHVCIFYSSENFRELLWMFGVPGVPTGRVWRPSPFPSPLTYAWLLLISSCTAFSLTITVGKWIVFCELS